MSQATDNLTAALAMLARDATNKQIARGAHDVAKSVFEVSHGATLNALAAVQAEIDGIAADSEKPTDPNVQTAAQLQP